MSKRSLEQGIESAKLKKQQSENELKLLIQQQRAEERKARTKRLIDRGAILESLIDGAAELTNDQIAEILKRTVGSSYGVKIIADVKSKSVTVPQSESPTLNGETATLESVETDERGGSISARSAEIEKVGS